MEGRIAKQAQRCNDKVCTVDISEFTDFDWDKLYIFNASVSPEMIAEAVGSDSPEVLQYTRPWIFTKNDKIVHAESNEEGIESVVEDEVLFHFPDSLKYQTYLRSQSLFRIIKQHDDKIPYYELYQIKRANK